MLHRPRGYVSSLGVTANGPSDPRRAGKTAGVAAEVSEGLPNPKSFVMNCAFGLASNLKMVFSIQNLYRTFYRTLTLDVGPVPWAQEGRPQTQGKGSGSWKQSCNQFCSPGVLERGSSALFFANLSTTPGQFLGLPQGLVCIGNRDYIISTSGPKVCNMDPALALVTVSMSS